MVHPNFKGNTNLAGENDVRGNDLARHCQTLLAFWSFSNKNLTLKWRFYDSTLNIFSFVKPLQNIFLISPIICNEWQVETSFMHVSLF